MVNSSGRAQLLVLLRHLSCDQLITCFSKQTFMVSFLPGRPSDQTTSEEGGILGLDQGTGKGVRVRDGAHDLCAHSRAGLVPFCVGVPDKVALQPGVQPRAADLKDSCREERRQCILRLISLVDVSDHYFFLLLLYLNY